MSKLSTLRFQAFQAQNGNCYYCGQRMWIHSANEPRPSPDARFQCTAEHLIARQDGGRDVTSNIVAACWFCNSRRHRSKKPLPPRAYLAHVHRRMSKRKWNA